MGCWKYRVITKHRPKGFLFKDFDAAYAFCVFNNIRHSLIIRL